MINNKSLRLATKAFLNSTPEMKKFKELLEIIKNSFITAISKKVKSIPGLCKYKGYFYTLDYVDMDGWYERDLLKYFLDSDEFSAYNDVLRDIGYNRTVLERELVLNFTEEKALLLDIFKGDKETFKWVFSESLEEKEKIHDALIEITCLIKELLALETRFVRPLSSDGVTLMLLKKSYPALYNFIKESEKKSDEN